MSTNLEYRAREKEKVSGRPAKLNEEKGDRDLFRPSVELQSASW